MSEQIRSRRAAREAAFQAIYAVEVGGLSVSDVMAEMRERLDLHPENWTFTDRLVEECLSRRDELEGFFSPFLTDKWPLNRLATTDRTLLRMGCYEFQHESDIPPKVTLNEYTWLAGRFGDEGSSRFVNGVLGAVLPMSAKAEWVPPETGLAEEEEPWPAEPGPAEVDPEVAAGPWTVRIEE